MSKPSPGPMSTMPASLYQSHFLLSTKKGACLLMQKCRRFLIFFSTTDIWVSLHTQLWLENWLAPHAWLLAINKFSCGILINIYQNIINTLHSASCRDFDQALIRGTVGDHMPKNISCHICFTSCRWTGALVTNKCTSSHIPAAVDQDIV